MKKQIILPLSLLLSFVAIRASDVPAVEPLTPTTEQTSATEITPEPATPAESSAQISATPVAEPTPTPVTPTVTPVVPAPVAPATTVAAIPTEADINNLLGLVAAYQHQAGVLKSLHELASDDSIVATLPNEDSVRSLLNLLELHKKEADLITSLRASLASIQASLGQWDADVASLVTKQKKSAKQKVAKRNLDNAAVKDLVSKPRGNN
jgi:hypothetical protein